MQAQLTAQQAAPRRAESGGAPHPKENTLTERPYPVQRFLAGTFWGAALGTLVALPTSALWGVVAGAALAALIWFGPRVVDAIADFVDGLT